MIDVCRIKAGTTPQERNPKGCGRKWTWLPTWHSPGRTYENHKMSITTASL
jgi:hypothetical protein